MEYIRTVLLTAVLVCFAGAIAPASPKLQRALGIVLSVLFLSVLLTPTGLASLWEAFTVPPAEEEVQTPEMLEAAWRKGIEEGITKDLTDRFSLSPSGLTVRVLTAEREGERVIQKVTVRCSGSNILADHTGIIRYIESAYGAESEVSVFE